MTDVQLKLKKGTQTSYTGFGANAAESGLFSDPPVWFHFNASFHKRAPSWGKPKTYQKTQSDTRPVTDRGSQLSLH